MSLRGGSGVGSNSASNGLAPQDSFIATVVFVIDDNSKTFWNGTVGSLNSPIRTLCKTNRIKLGFSVEPDAIQRGDTVTATLSVSNLRNMIQSDGAEAGSGGFTEPNYWFSGTIGRIATGNYTQAQLSTGMAREFGWAVTSIRDTLGLGTPRWMSHSNSSGSAVFNQYVARYFDYAVSSPSGATGTSTYTAASGHVIRPNENYTFDLARWGMWGTGGGGGRLIAAMPGVRGDPYEIPQCLAESSDTATVYSTLRHAMSTRGLVVVNIHSFVTWETALAGNDGVKAMLEYIKGKCDVGRMRVVVPSVGFDLYYRAPLKSQVRYGTDNFQDYDKDGHLDWWFSNRGNNMALPDTVRLKPSVAVTGHGGKAVMSLDWAGEDGSTSWGPTGAVNDAYEGTRACFAAIPPAGGGWTARFEVWIAVDSIGGSYSGTVAGDTVGVVFGGPFEQYMNRWGSTITPGWVLDTGSVYPFQMSGNLYVNGVTPGNIIRLGSRNRITDAAFRWQYVEATWDVPEISDYLYVSIWKTAQSSANSILISDYSLTFFRRKPLYAD